ncbi:RimJ/RimL family protein N-acetyltransferase [Crossiella equi]|uniref:RimJ/RimL family protein N-acetyltransferase n=1 Tax=Crossiella equi TaxID=130796 RepID=A0ABS5ASI4_9PSEU|nr:GNAT family N-acetyltransferase [Crossiella equi]MBP2478645.1 RimJ/RimL family protein N-acetyltransferase [Crossiella equi]
MSPHVRIVHLTLPVFTALADGDLAAANAVSPVPLTPYLVTRAAQGTWLRRAKQTQEDPEEAGWVTGVIWDTDHGRAVGMSGYHGRPDEDGMVEIGYSVDPGHRRRGYARAALAALIDRARQDPAVRTVRLSISPDNTPSLGLAAQFGFVQTGELWDEEDGWENVYEISVTSP